jgi:hypothetical protein
VDSVARGRDLATRIIRGRKLLIQGTLDLILEDRQAQRKHASEYSQVQGYLAVFLSFQPGWAQKRLIDPADRKVQREGILAQQGILNNDR